MRFPAYEAAMENNDLEATATFAAGLRQYLDVPPVFRNLDVVRFDTDRAPAATGSA